MTRIKLVTVSAITIIIILGSSLVVAGQPRDDDVQSDRPAIGGGLGHALKK
jgi:hypothetical protein